MALKFNGFKRHQFLEFDAVKAIDSQQSAMTISGPPGTVNGFFYSGDSYDTAHDPPLLLKQNQMALLIVTKQG